MTLTMRVGEKWIGLFEVTPSDGSEVLGIGRSAFVNVVAVAENAEAFIDVVTRELAEHRLAMIRVTDVERYKERIARVHIDDALRVEAARVPNELPVAFGEFHTFPIAFEN